MFKLHRHRSDRFGEKVEIKFSNLQAIKVPFPHLIRFGFLFAFDVSCLYSAMELGITFGFLRDFLDISYGSATALLPIRGLNLILVAMLENPD